MKHLYALVTENIKTKILRSVVLCMVLLSYFKIKFGLLEYFEYDCFELIVAST